ncbi:SRPBCC family protein [Capillimicrobium parvum]|uniref:Carbon monoxide dehydrogenase n=1 Tax=Capillimicrobium parvum TaxID=2884022 RepID=A0A9E6XY66_9ACTN|nr:SRPBCC family protein [Capillimicrobium parvum]UGS35976.1 hypothetical protein DSM104329_02373 [Capillimicrobium parvum]
MQIHDSFVLSAPVSRVWELLDDIERTAPCVPGFELAGRDGEIYTGVMRIKVGAITMTYDSRIRFLERDEQARRLVIAVEGRESRGDGGVSSTTTSALTPHDGGTAVSLTTDVEVSGRAAQFGRGVIGDVSARLVKRFVTNIEAQLTPQETERVEPEAVTVRTPEPVDLIAVSRVAVAKRVAPVAAVAIAALVVWRLAR